MKAHSSAPWLTLCLLGVLAAPGCSSDGDDPSCPFNNCLGDLVVETQTSGANQDQNGYSLSVQGPGVATTIYLGNNDTYTFGTIEAGQYNLNLGDVAANCSVGGATRSATVESLSVTNVRYSVTCN